MVLWSLILTTSAEERKGFFKISSFVYQRILAGTLSQPSPLCEPHSRPRKHATPVLLGAEKFISIDNIPERLLMAEEAGAETLNFQNDDERNLFDQFKDKTGGRGPDACVDTVGMEAHGTSPGEIYDWAKMGLQLATDRPNVLRQAIQACRKGGVVSVPGVYMGLLDKIPYGAFFAKGLSMHTGQTHVQKFLSPLMGTIAQGKIDPSFVITHRLTLDEAPDAYETFKHKKDGCIKVVLKPWEENPDGKIRDYAEKVRGIS